MPITFPPESILFTVMGAATLLGAAVAVEERVDRDELDALPNDDLPRGDLLTREQLVERCRLLSTEHGISSPRKRARPLLKRVAGNARSLFRAYLAIAGAARRQEAITPAAEWLLDNFHIVEEQISDVRKHLPRGFYGQLPKLAGGRLDGFPRVYALAVDLISHSDGLLDEQTLVECARAYQSATALTIGEIWAFAIMLRVGLLENLRALVVPLEAHRVARVQADGWADRVMEAATNRPGDLVVLLGELARRGEKLSPAYVVRLLQRLRGRGAVLMPVLDWLDQHVHAVYGMKSEELVRMENQLQAASQVSISNIITSFRTLDSLDWEEFFESVSVVEATLRTDPGGVYPENDFETRDSCRHSVERIARRSGKTELEVAAAAIDMASEARRLEPGDERVAHVGYYLIDTASRTLEKRLGYRIGPNEGLRRFVLDHPTPVYLGSILLVAAALTALVVALIADGASLSPGMALLAVLITLIPASDLAVGFVNRILTLYLPPRRLAKRDLRGGIPHDCRTLVAIPALLGSEGQVDDLLERIEVHYLANPDRNLHFALLTDFTDAPSEELPSDMALLHRAVVGILSLNERYEGTNQYIRFFLFHRRRRWNASQGCWMGWERKRGKLMELNRLLRGADDTGYQVTIGDRRALEGTRYVICLDADTQLPPESARRMIGTLSHPLNRAVVDERARRVVRGFGILQPRVSVALTSSARTAFTRIFSGNPGVDPYTTAVSDVYQDLFGEGIFVGKGAYDIDAFEHVLADRVGENTLLSHDLFEGNFARCGLITDIELFDDYPTRYNSWAARQHRWIRGDWQLVLWLMPWVRTPRGTERNPLPLIARWKIFDNLRRSLVAPGLLVLLAAGWLAVPGQAWVFTLAAVLVVLFPIFAHLTSALIVDPRAVPWSSYFWGVWYDMLADIQQLGLSLTFVAHQAASSMDAIGRTLWRVFVTHRSLLEWQTAADTERRIGTGPRSFLRRMWAAPVLALALGIAVAVFRPEALPASVPLLFVWLLSPLIAYLVSQPTRERPQPLSADERTMLRVLARKTWRFFQEWVTAEDHWLPPDNVQEDRAIQIAHRTSPTNVGLMLLSTVSARDFGYLGMLETVDRLERTLWNLAALERYRGHFFNWYETEGPSAIPPFYVSTVDSGNLAGHLLAVKQFCAELRGSPVFSTHTLRGLRDTLAVIRRELRGRGPWLAEECSALEAALEGEPHSGPQWQAQLEEIVACVARLSEQARCSAPQAEEIGEEVCAWCGHLTDTVKELQRDLETLIPWARLLAVQPPPFGDGMPLSGDITGRSHVFPELVTPPGGRPRGLHQIAELMDRALGEVNRLELRLQRTTLPDETLAEARDWLVTMEAALEKSRVERVQVLRRLDALCELCSRLVSEMDFTFLYDEKRDLFSVGYDTVEARPDHYHYDLLASECRLTSFVAIARQQVPQKHWFRMGRSLTAGRDRALVSWSGTMFEYLMPLLVMRSYDGTLLSDTMPAVIRQQRRYGAREQIPWGVSESGFVARDPSLNYQYRAFGVPGLGLKPDLFEDLVVAPYATLLALPIAPRAAVENLKVLLREGLESKYGFYEAVDYTPSRLQRGQRSEIVRSWMAHHQGMALVSLANYLLDNRMQARFHADPLVKSAELLLQERNPREAPPAHPQTEQVLAAQHLQRDLPAASVRHFRSAHTSTPRAQLLSNGRYAVMVTNSGGSYSSWRGMAVTRWREDVTRDHWGMFLYLRDRRSGDVWSAAQQPLAQTPEQYDVYFTEDKAEFHRRHNGIVSRLEIAVSAEDDVEVRRLALTNTTDTPREIEVTSYAEVVLASPGSDLAHTTFSNLFLETELLAERNALLATRRPRSASQSRVWALHVLAHEGLPADAWAATQCETDRARFIGRGRTTADPETLTAGTRLSGTTGPVLDPILSLRQRVRIDPRQTVRMAFTVGAAASREEAVRLAERYHDLRASSRAFELAWTHSQVELRQMNLSAEEANLCQRLASRVLYVDDYVRPSADVLARNTLGQSGLWAYGISGDLPILLAQVSSFDHLPLVRNLLVAHEYLRLKGLACDLVILNEHPPSYLQVFDDALQDAARNEGSTLDQPGGVFLRRAELIPDAGRHLLLFVARAVFSGLHGSLSDQLDWRPERKDPPEPFEASRLPMPPQPLPVPEMDLLFNNGLGGFTRDGSEYVVRLGGRDWTPAPWINVVANERFGFIASEAGLGFTWSENSRENRLTPWSNDPVSDSPAEVVYLRNEDTGRLWSVTPLPIRETNPYVIRHGAGYTCYQHVSHGVEQELLVFVPPGESVKVYRLRLRNTSDRPQPLSATFYADWVLGVSREQTHAFVATLRDPDTGALLARNSYNGEFAHRVAFADVNRTQPSWTCDRTEFLGRNGSPARPRAMRRVGLAECAGAELDPCAALQVKFDLPPRGNIEVVFTLGEGAHLDESRGLIRKYRDPAQVSAAFERSRAEWAGVLGCVQVSTPDPAFDLLLNRWLLYQTLACRVWGRSAFYQSGGAFGFRDQLQDVMALVSSGSSTGTRIAREQILLHASRQFLEGDVQHWWHPPTGRGIRTRFSDDLLWLPYVTLHFVGCTGDTAILEETAPFLHGRPLTEGEDEYYDQPLVSQETGSLYDHCLRAIRRANTRGAHGLPLMGTGDWNDGMNKVGDEGRGESVWVGWFLYSVLRDFAPLCESHGDPATAAEFRASAEQLIAAIEGEGWDGEWYRRAYMDDGSPLGSASSEECKIDAIAQSWAVISGGGDPERARQAMRSVETHLVRENDGLILLFTPPFDNSPVDPGYIKGYVPGVRENGGQYTHAALWTVLATALLGHGNRASELFSLLNPINHAKTPADMAKYRVEPYVVAADVYGVPPHTGRGGWTWYTGSASWMYRVGLEAILGFRLRGDHFTVDPCIPSHWPEFKVTYRDGETVYFVTVENPEKVERGVASVEIHGEPCPDKRIPLRAEPGEHHVRVVLGGARKG